MSTDAEELVTVTKDELVELLAGSYGPDDPWPPLWGYVRADYRHAPWGERCHRFIMATAEYEWRRSQAEQLVTEMFPQ
jgi:hypothetical protein